MSASKRERVQARKRYEKYQARQAKKAERHNRNVALGASLTALVALALIVVAVRPSSETLEDPFPDETQTAASPSAKEQLEPVIGPRTTDSQGNSLAQPDPELAEGRQWAGTIWLNGEPVNVTLDGQNAPVAVANFVYLAKAGYFDMTQCHRLTTEGIFVLQCGDPEATGGGTSPGYSWGPIENAPSDNVYQTGTLAMARVGGDGNSMGSQFFIVYADSQIPSDDAGGYTVFGEVTSGMDYVYDVSNAGVEGGGGDGAPTAQAVIKAVDVQ